MATKTSIVTTTKLSGKEFYKNMYLKIFMACFYRGVIVPLT